MALVLTVLTVESSARISGSRFDDAPQDQRTIIGEVTARNSGGACEHTTPDPIVPITTSTLEPRIVHAHKLVWEGAKTASRDREFRKSRRQGKRAVGANWGHPGWAWRGTVILPIGSDHTCDCSPGKRRVSCGDRIWCFPGAELISGPDATPSSRPQTPPAQVLNWRKTPQLGL
ncbi:uncharacterized protein B0H64DRAFT_84985 [Chaetomium fimeti]|uniref:Uncharacterized protein n=1 Tax=Chaetomium fimeti TaxID=1854472 RepID=A0AAE0HLR0_9PEZI|nr:hypothetical protein B0H64DRAFT_84985 [Chaetomium fimeti]